MFSKKTQSTLMGCISWFMLIAIISDLVGGIGNFLYILLLIWVAIIAWNRL